MPLLHVQAGSADQLQDIADALWKARKVVVITGAGISTNSGIPVSIPLLFRLGFQFGAVTACTRVTNSNRGTRTFDPRMAYTP